MNDRTLMEQDLWTYRWAEYMVWSLRIISYSLNFHIFNAVRSGLVPHHLHSFLYDLVVLVYAIVMLGALERFYRRVHNPAHKGRDLEVSAYRVSGERIIFSCVTFCAITFFLGFGVGMLTKGVNGQALVPGVFGGVASGLFALFGTIFLVAQNPKTRKRLPILCAVGLLFQIFPVGFVMYTAILYVRSFI